MIGYWPVLAYVALVCCWTGAATTCHRNSQLPGRPTTHDDEPAAPARQPRRVPSWAIVDPE